MYTAVHKLVGHYESSIITIDDTNDQYSIIKASKNGDLESVKHLVSIKKHVGFAIHGAICLASKYGHVDIVKYLVPATNNADILIPDFLDIAIKYGHLEVVKYFVSFGKDIYAHDNVMIAACKFGHLDIVKYLVSLGLSIHIRDDVPIYWASKMEHLELVKYLISKGANIKRIYGARVHIPYLIKHFFVESEFDILIKFLDKSMIKDKDIKETIIKIKNKREIFFVNLRKINDTMIITEN